MPSLFSSLSSGRHTRPKHDTMLDKIPAQPKIRCQMQNLFDLFQTRIQLASEYRELQKRMRENTSAFDPVYAEINANHDSILQKRSAHCSIPIWHSTLFPSPTNTVWLSKAGKVMLAYPKQLIPENELISAYAMCVDSCGARECKCNQVNELWVFRDNSKLVRSIHGTILLPK